MLASIRRSTRRSSPHIILTRSIATQRIKMATPSKVKLSRTQNVGVFHMPGITDESAAKASELLQENHEIHHIFFNASGYHVGSFRLSDIKTRFPYLSDLTMLSYV